MRLYCVGLRQLASLTRQSFSLDDQLHNGLYGIIFYTSE